MPNFNKNCCPILTAAGIPENDTLNGVEVCTKCPLPGCVLDSKDNTLRAQAREVAVTTSPLERRTWFERAKDKREEIMQDYDNGLKGKKLAEKYGISKYTFRKLKDAN